ncbi:hypothetical protein V1525DRAFT_387470 [Lipomyces kononenkoae]|uniref:Uncharacterized protein n=1 Tax=Lipomyces kononenkoae TaxID=34357 RepID=A0ACC3T3Q5_LIPKO
MARGVTNLGPPQSAPNYGDNTLPIAVVGMACRLPGEATDPEKLWKILAEQRDVWTITPSDRFNQGLYYHPDPSRNGTSNVPGGHFLHDHPGFFDAPFFNMTHAEATALDPQQRLLLECAYEAVENAGIPLEKLIGSNTAVFVGSSCRDYADIMGSDLDRTELYQSTGTGQTMLSNRISYFFDLKGPSAFVDTACSSSLVALHLACNAIRTGESTQAIVGGSNLILGPAPQIALSMLRFLSPDGRCYAYDERGNGFGRGEGASCIMLKRLDEALQAGDTIRAVIRNSGTNHDGKTAGITLPSGKAQVELINSLYRAAGIDPFETTYVEAHGTGTAAGDPIEAGSLSTVFSPGRSPEEPLKVGSVKSNIGHLEGGSGVAAVVKTVLMLEKGYILPNLDFRKANPRIPMHEWKIEVPTAVQPWNPSKVRRASINNFGFGGSNAHVIIEDACSYLAAHGLEGNVRHVEIPPTLNDIHLENGDQRPLLFVLSAMDEASGARQVNALLEFVATREGSSLEFLDDLAFTLGERRTVLPWRAAIPSRSIEQLKNGLNSQSAKFVKAQKNVKVGFVFTGQGAQWCGMGRELTDAYPIYRDSLLRSESMLKALGAPWSLLDELAQDDTSRLGTALFSQPLCTAIQIALVDLLKSWNITPSSVTGHSSGEIAAAYAVGVLTQEAALAVAYHRGVAAASLKDVPNPCVGAMMAVGLSRDETQDFINHLNNVRANIACINSPTSVTVSGDEAAIDELQAVLHEKGVFARKLAVDIAYHSHHMNAVFEQYLASLQNLQIVDSGSGDFYSSVCGTIIDLKELKPNYWATNMVSPVEFCDSLLHLVLGKGSTKQKRRGGAAVDVLVEIGPHSALSGPIKQILKTDTKLSSVQYVSALIRNTNAVDTCLQLASRLLQSGIPVDLHAVNCPSGHESNKLLVDLPPYSWNHSTMYWAKGISSSQKPHTTFPRSDFLGIPIGDSSSPDARWRNILRTSEIPWIQDHNVQSNTVCPAAFYLVMAIEAAYQRASTRGISIQGYNFREISIGHALVIPQESGEVEIMISLKPYNESIQVVSDLWDEFCVSSSSNGTSWTTHCRGLISVQKHTEPTEVDGGRDQLEEREEYMQMIKTFDDECTTDHDIENVYKALKELGLNFGPTFTNMKNARSSLDRCVATVSIPDTAEVMPASYQYPFILHPATLDGFIHPVFPISLNQNLDQGTPVPTFIREMYVSQNVANGPACQFDVYAKMDKRDLGNSSNQGLQHSRNSLVVFDKEKKDLKPAVKIWGLRFGSLHRESEGSDGNAQKLAHQINWRPDPDFLSQNQIVKLTEAFRVPPKVKNQAEMVQQAAFYYAEQALNEIPIADVPNMAPHHQKLYSTMTEMCLSVHEGRLGAFDTSAWTAVDKEGRRALCNKIRSTHYEILFHIGENLPRILRQEIDPLTLMMEDDRLERHYRMNQALSQSYEQAAIYADLLANKNPFLNVLEIGAGTGGATFPLLRALGGHDGETPRFANYDFTDISPGFFEKVMAKTKAFGELVSFKTLDIEQDAPKGFRPASYDLIVAANVLHATSNLENTMNRVRGLLKPGGTLILIEITVKNLAASVIFGTLPGWWIGEEETRQDGPLMTENEWDALLRKTNFTGTKAVLWDTTDPESHHSSTIISTAARESVSFLPEVIILRESSLPDPCAYQLMSHLSSIGVTSKLADITEHDLSNKLCIVLTSRTHCILRNPSPSQYDAIKRIFLKSAGVLWVSHGAQIESSAPDLNLVTGLARTIRAEKGDTMIVTLDLDAGSSASDRLEAETIFAVFKTNFGTNMGISEIDSEYAERDGVVMIPRVIEDHILTSFVMSSTGHPTAKEEPYHQEGRHLRAEIKTPGFLDSLQFVDDVRISGDLPHDFVQIEVKASGIEPYPLGCECAGVISAVGISVKGFRPGDHVIAGARGGAICTTIRVSTNEIEHIPEDLPFDIAASLPIVYFTAYYAVFKVARLTKGETILVHAASGGLGQAIINLALLVGADIYATVGTLEKKDLLMTEFHIPEDHIFSSRDRTFATGIMRRTCGKGVDVVMNSLSGDFLRLTWDCIAPFGRFVELGKRDMTVNTRLEMRHFEKNVAFTGLDVPLHTQFDEKRRIWTEVMAWYAEGRIHAPRPITTFAIAETEMALRTMQTGRHMGKLVLVPRPGDTVRVVRRDDAGGEFLRGEDASYLLIGGLGGIGRAIALYMVEHGARNLIFASRSGAASEKARDCVAQLKARGANVAVFTCDVSESADVDRVLEECARTMPPIRGLIHAAMVPTADLFGNMTLEDYNVAMRPKVDGIWNLHNRLSRTDVDFFIMLSSVVGLVGNPSQAAYVAASLFLDAFADFRNKLGLPAVSLDLGRVVGVGFVAENEAASRGVSKLWSRDIDEAELMALIASAMVAPRRTDGRPGASITALKPWAAAAGTAMDPPMFSHFRRAAMRKEARGAEGGLVARVRAVLREVTSLEEATRYVCDTVMEKMAALLMVPVRDISVSRSMTDYGMDSLVAVEMRNWLVREMDATVPILDLLANISLQELSMRIVQRSKVVNPAILVGKEM